MESPPIAAREIEVVDETVLLERLVGLVMLTATCSTQRTICYCKSGKAALVEASVFFARPHTYINRYTDGICQNKAPL